MNLFLEFSATSNKRTMIYREIHNRSYFLIIPICGPNSWKDIEIYFSRQWKLHSNRTYRIVSISDPWV